MFFHVPIRGDKLPDRTLCLTYDDGPGATERGASGPRTDELAHYLADEGIAATFFVIGERARGLREALGRLSALGHLVANHTEHHANLLALSARVGSVAQDVVPTDRLIRDETSATYTLFRPPYGLWRRRGQTSSPLADELNAESALTRCVGPVLWDVNGDDWQYWASSAPAELCARRYLAEIEARRRGIVLLHDSSFEAPIRDGNQSLAMAKLLVPELKRRGYRFVRLDDVPQVASALAVSRRVAIRAESTSRYLSSARDAAGAASFDAPAVGDGEEIGLVELGGERVALRASDGRFFAVVEGRIVADAARIHAGCIFASVSSPGGSVALRAPDDVHFVCGREGAARADARVTSSPPRFALIDV